MKLATPRWRQQFVLTTVLMLAGLVALIAPTAAAASGEATASVLYVSTGAGVTSPGATLTLTPSTGQIGSFNASVPVGWEITSHPTVSGLSWTSTTIQGRGLMITTAGFSVAFAVRAPCASAQELSSVAAAWSVAAKTGPNFTGSSFSITPQPSTPLTSACTATFFTDGSGKYRGPADAALNGRSTSQGITSDAFSPGGDAMQVEVLDGDDGARVGVDVTLVASGGGGGSATGDVTETSGSGGITTFDGTVSIAAIGQGYVLTPTGHFDGFSSDPFGIYQEGTPCSGLCTVHGKSTDNTIKSTIVASGNGVLGVLVADIGLSCDGSVPAGYDYRALTAHVTVWKYTGDGAQTARVLIDKTTIRKFLNRGSDHIDFCFAMDRLDEFGNLPTFTDKFGNVTSGPALLPDCNQTVDDRNCIVSETAVSGGARLVTVTVDDGKGRI